MKNDRCAINFEIFLLDILSCKGALTLFILQKSNSNLTTIDDAKPNSLKNTHMDELVLF